MRGEAEATRTSSLVMSEAMPHTRFYYDRQLFGSSGLVNQLHTLKLNSHMDTLHRFYIHLRTRQLWRQDRGRVGPQSSALHCSLSTSSYTKISSNSFSLLVEKLPHRISVTSHIVVNAWFEGTTSLHLLDMRRSTFMFILLWYHSFAVVRDWFGRWMAEDPIYITILPSARVLPRLRVLAASIIFALGKRNM